MFNWREHLKTHPAAELFPSMSEAELRELGEDIKKNGLQSPVIIYDDQLLDGRNRLDAMVSVGIEFEIERKRPGTLSFSRLDVDGVLAQGAVSELPPCADPYAYVLSANIRRRHLTAKQKRDLIAKVLKARPEKSNNQIAKDVKADDKTVAKVRRDLESTSEIPKLEKTVGADGRARKQRKPVTVRVQTIEHPQEPVTVRVTTEESSKEPVVVQVQLANGQPLKSLDGLSDAPKQQIAAAVDAGEQVDTPRDFWQRSLGNIAGDAISLETFWRREFGDWEKFEVTSDLVTLAEQAADAWAKLAAKLKAKVADKAAA